MRYQRFFDANIATKLAFTSDVTVCYDEYTLRPDNSAHKALLSELKQGSVV